MPNSHIKSFLDTLYKSIVWHIIKVLNCVKTRSTCVNPLFRLDELFILLVPFDTSNKLKVSYCDWLLV